MKKKLMMVAVLLGALFLGACVDDNESQSVTDVRAAKAEQLKSVAAMNNATAEATKLLAEADAAMKSAQTEAIKTQTQLAAVNVELAKVNVDLQKVMLEEEKVKLEQLKAELEVEKASLEYKKAKIAGDLKTLAMTLEQQLQEAKTALLKAQYDYNSQLEALSAQDQAKLGKLLTAYTQASTDLIEAKQSLANLKIDITSYENNLVDLKKAKEQAITKRNTDIALWNAEIEIWKQYKGVTYNDAKAAYDKANTKKTSLYSTYRTSWQAYTIADNKRNDAYNLINSSAYVNKFINAFRYHSYTNYYIGYNWVNGESFYGYSYSKNSVQVYVKLFSDVLDENHKLTPSYDDGRVMGTYFYNAYTNYYDINEDGFTTFFASLNADITAATTIVNTAQTAYNAAVTAEAATKTAAEASGATQAAIDAYAQAQIATGNKLYDLNQAKAVLAQAKADLATIKDAYDYLKTEASKFADAIAAYNSASKASEDASIQVDKDWYNYDKQSTVVSVLSNIMNQSVDVDSKIASLEGSIKSAQADIADLSSITSNEQLIERTKVEISNKEAEVAALEKEATAAKAALDAAMKE